MNFSGGAFAVIAQCLGGWQHHQIVKMSGTEGLVGVVVGRMDRTFEPTFSLKVQRGPTLEDVPIEQGRRGIRASPTSSHAFYPAIESGVAPAATGVDGPGRSPVPEGPGIRCERN